MPGESDPIELTPSLAQKLLPTCQRCRRLRRKCDTRLPDCWLCQKANVECSFFDHALQQVLPRAYVQSLLTQLERLKESTEIPSVGVGGELPATTMTISTQPLIMASQHEAPGLDNVQLYPIENVPELQRQTDISPGVYRETSSHSFDQHLFPHSAGGSSRFFGSSSSVILTVHVIRCAISSNLITEADFLTPSPSQSTSDILTIPSHRLLIFNESPANIQRHIETFLNTFGSIHGIIDATVLKQQYLPSYLTIRQLVTRPGEIHGMQMYQYFCVSMICAIGCSTTARHTPDNATKGLAFFEDVLPYVEEVTSSVSPQSLQALLLLTIFALFWPTKVDIWRLLDYCCRLSDELGYNAEPSDQLEDEAQKNLRRATFWGLYTLEGLVSQIFGRSPDLHEAIITTKFPETSTTTDAFGIAAPRLFPVAVHYRLMHIRFEIFKNLYVPAETPNFGLDWYRDQFRRLREWKVELDMIVTTQLSTTMCDIHYHSTICLLFQPLMLEAMASSATSRPQDMNSLRIPQENYRSACELIKAYESIIRARQDSALGEYPMTFISVHFIYIACMTLLSHALLALTGHDRTWKMSDIANVYESEKMDFSGLWSTSNSALLLLSWCSERWPGTQGMLDIYKKLADVIIPAMFRKGSM